MAIAFVQETVSAASLSAASSTTITATITPSAGSLLFVFVRGAATGGTMTCSDPTNGSYTAIDSRALLTNMKGWTFYKNVVAGSAVTITATWSAATTDRGMIVWEISGQDTGGSVLETFNSASALTVGPGTDTLTTPSMTPTAAPALVVGAYSDFGGVTITAGTGFTGATGRWTASGDSTLLEWQRITTTTGIAATWTPSGSTNGIMMGAIFKEASAAAVLARHRPSAWPDDDASPAPRRRRKAIGIGESVGLPALTGLKLWLRGDLGVTQSGGNVTAWADQSGNGNDTTNVGTVPFVASSINGKPGVTCSGSSGLQNLTSSPIAAGGPRTIYAVVKGSSEFGGAIYCNFRTSHTQEMWMMGATGSVPGIFYASDGATYQKIPVPVISRPLIVRAAVDGTAGGICAGSVNGIAQTMTTISATFVETGSPGFGVGILPYFTSSFGWQGDICEIIVLDHVASAGEEAAIQGYLAVRYGIDTVGFTLKPRRPWAWQEPEPWQTARRALLVPPTSVAPADSVLARPDALAPGWWDAVEPGLTRRVRLVPIGAAPAADAVPRRPAAWSTWWWETPADVVRRRRLVFPGTAPINTQVVRPPLVARVDDLELAVGNTQLGPALVVDATDLTLSGDT